MFLPAPADLNLRIRGDKGLDPEPIQKWAEEGFTVIGVTSSPSISSWSLGEALRKGVDALLAAEELDTRHKFAVIGATLLQDKHIRRVLNIHLQCMTPGLSLPSQHSLPRTPVLFV